MYILHNNQNSEYIIINFKIKEIKDINFELINKYYYTITEWVKQILDNYDKNLNWKFYICNLNFKKIRVFITIDKQLYAKTDKDTNSIYISNYSYNYHHFEILLNVILNQIDKKHFEILFKCKSYDNMTFDYDSESESENESISDFDNLENNNKNININKYDLIEIIGLSGISKETFISELYKIPLLKNSHYNSEYSSESIFNNDIYSKIYENNKYEWIITNNNYITYSIANNDELLLNFINKI